MKYSCNRNAMPFSYICRYALMCLCPLFWLFAAESCTSDDAEEPVTNYKTLFMYLPWSGNSSALTANFYQNISDMEESICTTGLNRERVIVFISTSSTEAEMFEIVYTNGICERVPLKEYTNPAFTTAVGITSILNDVVSFAPASVYAMIIGCHGLGWIPVDDGTRFASTLGIKFHWEREQAPLTRYFGGSSSEYQTDVSTLAEGIAGAGMKMEYILFDDCYMSSIEVAYELKDVTDHLIGSTSEVMAYGMPYATMGKHLLGIPDYQAICDAFYAFYSTYESPYGTLGVTDCSELDNLATIMKEINNRYTFNSNQTSSLQRLDGYTPPLFYDYGDYVSHLCEDAELLTEFEQQLRRAVPYMTFTDMFYSGISGRTYSITTFSGITISDPSTNSLASAKTETSWYRATH